MPLTYNQIIKLSKEFQAAHYQLKNFGNGTEPDTVLHNQDPAYKYPLMWMEDLAMPLEPGLETFSFRVYFLSQVEELENRDVDEMWTNINEVKSDMLQCAKDFVSYWTQDHSYKDLRIEKTAPRDTIDDVHADRLWGCSITIIFKQAYTYNKCVIPMAGITPAESEQVSITVNSVAFATVDPGTTFNVPVVDDDLNPVGSKVGSNWQVSTGGDPVSTSMNGTGLTDTPAGQTKAFTIRQEDDSPITVTTITDTANTFIGEVPNIVTAIAYVRNGFYAMNSNYLTHDLGWYLANETVFDYNVTGIMPLLDPDDDTKLLNNNAFGNLNRVTNSLGLTTSYDGTGGEIADYAIDHYTGYGWYLQDAVANNTSWTASAVAVRALTAATFSDWRMPTLVDFGKIQTSEGLTNIFTGIDSWSGSNFWAMCSVDVSTITFYRTNVKYTATNKISTFAPGSGNSGIRTVGVRNHY